MGCTTKEGCQARALTSLGSSDHFSQTVDFDDFAWSQEDERNPFAQWNQVFVPYCCGSMHSGRRTEASDETFGLYFSGHHTVRAVVDYLSVGSGMNETGNLVVFGGGSAGGVGVFANYEWVTRTMPQARVLGAPIGGFPPEIQFFTGLG